MVAWVIIVVMFMVPTMVSKLRFNVSQTISKALSIDYGTIISFECGPFTT